ncbi:Death-associated protein kinase dapk-1, partial [Trichinella nativa]
LLTRRDAAASRPCVCVCVVWSSFLPSPRLLTVADVFCLLFFNSAASSCCCCCCCCCRWYCCFSSKASCSFRMRLSNNSTLFMKNWEGKRNYLNFHRQFIMLLLLWWWWSSGQFAVVKRCEEKATGCQFAGKFIKKRLFNSSQRGAKRSDIQREIDVLREIGGHPNVISLHQVFETELEIILILELVAGGELFEHLSKKECLEEAEASAFVRQILLGLDHIHSKHIAHLDLKPENVMLKAANSTCVQLIDFGLSRRIPPDTCVKKLLGTEEFVGKDLIVEISHFISSFKFDYFHLSAPETINYDGLTLAADMWALGVVTYILLTGSSPFLGSSQIETFRNITAVRYQFDGEYFARTSTLAKDFIRRLLVRDPRQRLTAKQCLKHPWIEPQEAEHVALLRQSLVNTRQTRTLLARRRWKIAGRIVLGCVRLVRSYCYQTVQTATLHSAMLADNNSPTKNTAYLNSENLIEKAVMCACEMGNLIDLGNICSVANINFNDISNNELGALPTHVAAVAGQLDILKFLESRGCDFSLPDKRGDNPLHLAAQNGHIKIVNYLISRVDVGATNNFKENALHIAVRYGFLDIAGSLVMSGKVDLNAQDKHGETALHIACWHGYTLIASLLCNCKPDLGIKNKDGETPLICAAVRGNLDCVFLLKSAGADLEQRDKVEILSPKGNVHFCRASCVLVFQDMQTALHLSIRRQHSDIALPLLESMSNFHLSDKDGNTPLHVACKEGLTDVVQRLCQKGCQIDSVNEAGQTPLHIACKEGHLEIVKILCLCECNVHLKNKDGLTGEMIAAARNHHTICETLKKVKQDVVLQSYIKQFIPCDGQPLRRIKLKVFGHSGVGKTKLIDSLRQFGLLDNFLRRFSESNASVEDDLLKNNKPLSSRRPVDQPSHPGYTRGIEVHNIAIASGIEFSTWEFSGYSPYCAVYDRFIGNGDCIHVVVFNVTDPTEVQYRGVIFWMNFIKSCFSPDSTIGPMGVSNNRPIVVLVATHVDQVEQPISLSADGEWTSSDADALLSTIKLRFCTDFEIHDSIIVLDANAPNCVGMKTLRAVLTHHRKRIVELLPNGCGLLEACVNLLGQLRRTFATFPALRWSEFFRHLQDNANPLASEFHCRVIVELLQLLGEVVYVRCSPTEQGGDWIVINPNWLCQAIIGRLLSAEFLQTCQRDGCYTADEMLLLFPQLLPNVTEMMRLLDAIGLGTVCEFEDDVTFEFPCMNFEQCPPNYWDPSPKRLVYGGLRFLPRRGMDHLMRASFLRVQKHLRHCSQFFPNHLKLELSQWHGGCKLTKNSIEAAVVNFGKDQGIELRVRGPREFDVECFCFFDDLISLIEQTVAEAAPGLLLERHFLSARDLAQHNSVIQTYPPGQIFAMQLAEGVLLSDSCGGEEPFLDVVCFGSKSIALSLTLGIDMKIISVPTGARRELASLLDPMDTMGRDWSILAAKLGLGPWLAEIESACEPGVSKTDRVLGEWFARRPSDATVGALLRCLKEMGRDDAIDLLCRSAPLYAFSPTNVNLQTFATDSGLGSNNSRTAFDTPTISENMFIVSYACVSSFHG